MASINDVFNQLVTCNATLSTINSSVNAGTAATNAVKASVDTLDNDTKAGFAATDALLGQVVAALGAIAQINIEQAKLQFHLTQQADTMICALEHISRNTCELVTQATIQTELQKGMRKDLDGLLSIMESAYPSAALELERHAALRAQIERCCPPDQPKPACTYDPCPRPKSIEEPKLPKPPRPVG